MKQGGRQWAVCDDYGTASEINGAQTLVEKALGLKFEARNGLNRGDYYLYYFQSKTDREAIFYSVQH